MNVAALHKLNQEIGSGTLKNVLADFLNELQQRKNAIVKAIETHDFKTYREQCHALKANSQTLGAEALHQHVSRQEQRVKEGLHEEVLAHWNQTESLIDSAHEFLQRFSQLIED